MDESPTFALVTSHLVTFTQHTESVQPAVQPRRARTSVLARSKAATHAARHDAPLGSSRVSARMLGSTVSAQ